MLYQLYFLPLASSSFFLPGASCYSNLCSKVTESFWSTLNLLYARPNFPMMYCVLWVIKDFIFKPMFEGEKVNPWKGSWGRKYCDKGVVRKTKLGAQCLEWEESGACGTAVDKSTGQVWGQPCVMAPACQPWTCLPRTRSYYIHHLPPKRNFKHWHCCWRAYN